MGVAARVALACGAAAWAGALLGLHTGAAALPPSLLPAAAGLWRRRWAWVVVAAALAGGVLSGIMASGNISDYVSSVQGLTSLQLDEFYPGHGKDSTLGAERGSIL